ncbi:MAG: NADH-quinone oxidoreductase subunit NuoK [Spirosomataceae bacterium]|jgi:NADH-quinone oxidoreductase subunit K
MNNLIPYLAVSTILFSLGLAITVTKKNLILMLMGLELMLNAVNINLVAFSKYDPNPEKGQVMAIMVMLVAASEIAVGLAIILKIRKFYNSVDPEQLDELKK